MEARPVGVNHALRDRRGILLPATGIELVRGLRPEFLESLALQRANRGGVAKSGDHYYDYGRPIPTYLTGAFDDLAGAGLLALAEEDPWCMRRLSLTETGRARYTAASGPPTAP